MSLLFTNEILSAVTEELKNAKESVQIITAYCKENSINKLNENISDFVLDKKLMVRFRLDDLLKGSTDFSVLDFGKHNGWKVYIRFDLHAKTYIVDNKRGFVGSANTTQSGMTGAINNNIEVATLVDIEERDREKVAKLFDEAILVDDLLYEKLRNQLEEINQDAVNYEVQWSKDIRDIFQPHVDTLFSYELPEKREYEIGEFINFLEIKYNVDIGTMKDKLRWSNAYLWLLDVLKNKKGEMYFGELSAELHNSLVEDPKPYRRDVKVYLANLLSLIEAWDMDEIKIDRPNYSQRIRLM
jgi:Phosphatidylserine/phosphatidylglycerophosphate/cardiolipin synthases and related enzymes